MNLYQWTQAAILTSCIFIIGCQKNIDTEHYQDFEQYASKVIDFSTEYTESPGPWSSFVILGEPDTYPEYGDIMTSWASKSPNSMAEYIILGFDRLQYVSEVNIYETYNPGAVAEVQIHNAETNTWEIVFSEIPSNKIPQKSRINNISFPLTTYLVDEIRIYLQNDKVPGWNEIDAVSIKGSVKN